MCFSVDHVDKRTECQNLSFIERNGGIVLLLDGYQYTKKKQYNKNKSRWVCVKLRSGCAGVLNMEVSYFDFTIKTSSSYDLCFGLIQNFKKVFVT